MKKIIFLACILFTLCGCKQNVSGSFTGVWSYEKNPNYGIATIKDEGDHYSVHQVSKNMNIDIEYKAVEVDGKYLQDEKSGKRYFTLIDEKHIKMGENGGIYLKNN
ncbi:membrane lipoprotein lipid attachment site-containing protein [Salmonella enterica]